MTELEIMDWLDKRDSEEDDYLKCLKRRIAACVKVRYSGNPSRKYLNSPAKDILMCTKCKRELDKPGENDYMCPAIHAESKAILDTLHYQTSSYRNLKDYELFVTHFPCKNCALLSIYVEISRIFYRHDYYNKEEEEGRRAIEYVEFFLKKSGIDLLKI